MQFRTYKHQVVENDGVTEILKNTELETHSINSFIHIFQTLNSMDIYTKHA